MSEQESEDVIELSVDEINGSEIADTVKIRSWATLAHIASDTA